MKRGDPEKSQPLAILDTRVIASLAEGSLLT
jgi:hypothetical protein